MKRLLYLVHRWAGIAVALFMLMWFVSGLVIMYAGASALNASEQLARREPLDVEPGWLSLGEAWRLSAAARAQLPDAGPRNEAAAPKHFDGGYIAAARLVRQAGAPLWLVENGSGQRFALSASSGELHATSADEAVRIAAHWLEHDADAGAAIRVLDTGPQDSSVRNYETIAPFHRLALGDDGRELLISARTGEVVRDSTPFARALYWTGNWIHLLRPVEALGSAAARRNVQIWSGFIAFGACLTGLIIGWQRWRPGWFGRATYSKGRVHPYRDVWSTWHFWVGLIGGTAALLWAFSGYLSTNPWRIFSPANAERQELSRYQGTQAPAAMLDWRPLPPAERADAIVELDWHYVGGAATLLGTTRSGEKIAQSVAGASTGFDEAALVQAAAHLLPDAPLAAHALQTEYDSYYYLRRGQSALDRPLPVLRVEFADRAGTRIYLDPQSGRLLLKQDVSRRVYRWLYSALHHWDFGWLQLRPLWDLWMLPLVSMGVVLGATSVVLGWKRLQQDLKPKKKKATARAPRPVREAPVPRPHTAADLQG